MIKFYSIHYNRPDFIKLQLECLRKNLFEPFELIIVNNAKERFFQEEIFAMCDLLGLKQLIPTNPNHSLPGESHFSALKLIQEEIIQKTDDKIIICDHDIFMYKPQLIDDWFKYHDIIGIAQNKQGINYLHPGLLGLNLQNLRDKEQIDLYGGEVKGVRVDVGGQFHNYLFSHPYIPVNKLSYQSLENEFEVFGGCWFHIKGASNWQHLPKDENEARIERAKELIRLG